MEKMDNVQERRGDISREMANLRRIEKRNVRYQKHYNINEECLLWAHLQM